MSQKLASGHEVVPVSKEWEEEYTKDMLRNHHGLIRLQPGGIFIQAIFTKYADAHYNFEYRPTDVLVTSFPRSGSTWTQEIIWTMIHNPNLDNPKANEEILVRLPVMNLDMFEEDSVGYDESAYKDFLEAFAKICPGKNPKDGAALQIAQVTPDRRVLKDHLHLCLFKPELINKAKIVYVARNPRDVLVSYYNLYKNLNTISYTGDINKYGKYFMNDEVYFAPYWSHVKGAWVRKDDPNVHFMFFEDMKADIIKELKKLDAFLGTNLTDQQLENVKQHTSFNVMKARGEPVNSDNCKEKGQWIRKGQAGDWKNHFSAELDKEFTEWIKKNVGDSGLPFN